MTKTPDIDWFVDNGCELTRPNVAIFLAVYASTYSQPCKDCNCKPTCPAYPKLSQRMYATPLVSRCPKCNSPLNAVKVLRLNGRCACGQEVTV